MVPLQLLVRLVVARLREARGACDQERMDRRYVAGVLAALELV